MLSTGSMLTSCWLAGQVVQRGGGQRELSARVRDAGEEGRGRGGGEGEAGVRQELACMGGPGRRVVQTREVHIQLSCVWFKLARYSYNCLASREVGPRLTSPLFPPPPPFPPLPLFLRSTFPLSLSLSLYHVFLYHLFALPPPPPLSLSSPPSLPPPSCAGWSMSSTLSSRSLGATRTPSQTSLASSSKASATAGAMCASPSSRAPLLSQARTACLGANPPHARQL